MGCQYVCQACGRRLTVPDELFAKKVRGRIVTINCKGCGRPVSIDGTVPPPSPTATIATPTGPEPSRPKDPDRQAAEGIVCGLPPSDRGTAEFGPPIEDSGAFDRSPADLLTNTSFAPLGPAVLLSDEPGSGRFSHVDGPLPFRTPIARIGRYSLFDQFAAGGIATVHFGRIDGAGRFSRVVAIKRLLAHLTKDDEFTAMLLQEARLAARVRHPNVVPTLDVVTLLGDVLLVLEYVHGEALSTLCRIQAKQKKDHVPLNIAATIMHDVLSGLCAVHEATDEKGRMLGLIHRDISPPNIVVGADGYSRVLDFGIAKALEHIEETMPNRLKGKIGYMSPEQIRGEGATQSSDVFAAGVIIWELLATRRLFASSNEADRMKQIVSGNYPRPSRYRSGLPKTLEQVAMHALEVDPKARYQNAREFSEALEQALPRASARAVSEWVHDLAKDTLTERAHMIAQVENWDGGSEGPLHPAPLEGDGLPKNGLSDKPNVTASKHEHLFRRNSLEGRLATIAPARGKLATLLGAILLLLAVYYVLRR
jgi:serine/threonine protein kinase